MANHSIDYIPRSLGSAIRQIRKSIGYTQQSLAMKTGLTQSFISQLEKDIKKPTIEALGTIALALNVPQSFLSYIMERETLCDRSNNDSDVDELFQTVQANMDVLVGAYFAIIAKSYQNAESELRSSLLEFRKSTSRLDKSIPMPAELLEKIS